MFNKATKNRLLNRIIFLFVTLSAISVGAAIGFKSASIDGDTSDKAKFYSSYKNFENGNEVMASPGSEIETKNYSIIEDENGLQLLASKPGVEPSAYLIKIGKEETEELLTLTLDLSDIDPAARNQIMEEIEGVLAKPRENL